MSRVVLLVLAALVPLSLVYTPGFWVTLLVFVDYYTPWILFESSWYDKYHHFLVDGRAERPELPVPEMQAHEANPDSVFKLSKGLTFPIVIRGAIANETSVKQWHDHRWWIENYPQEQVLCGTLSEVVEDCTIRSFFRELEAGNPFYISGASEIFNKNPELHDMVDSNVTRLIEPGDRLATQVFMGVPTMGSDIHSAAGLNVFRQVAGQKKWWFIPPSETAFLKPSINVNGISAHTATLVGKLGGTPSPWLTKIERYTSILNPGDVLLNPPWFWHGILNLGEANSTELVIGCPSRYNRDKRIMKAAFQSNAPFMVNTMIRMVQKYGMKSFDPKFKVDLEGDIADNRRSREGKALLDRTSRPQV